MNNDLTTKRNQKVTGIYRQVNPQVVTAATRYFESKASENISPTISSTQWPDFGAYDCCINENNITKLTFLFFWLIE